MAENITIWKLTAGGMEGQETSEQKLTEGMAYVDRLKADGINVIDVQNDGKKLTIITEE